MDSTRVGRCRDILCPNYGIWKLSDASPQKSSCRTTDHPDSIQSDDPLPTSQRRVCVMLRQRVRICRTGDQTMFVVRNRFVARPGCAGRLAAQLKEAVAAFELPNA